MREIYLIMSWVSNVIHSSVVVYVLVNDLLSDNLYFILVVISIAHLYLLDIMGITQYYHDLNDKKALSILVCGIIFSVFAFFLLGVEMALLIASIFVLGIQGYMMINPLIHYHEFKKKIGSGSRWYFITYISASLLIPITIYTTSLGYTYAVADAEDNFIIMLFYVPSIVAFVFVILLLVHLEYITLSKKKDNLKDIYSHNLGNIMQSIRSAQELIKSKKIPIEEIIELEGMIETKINEASELIREIRNL